MAEIKSTLDLVMERTRDLTLSEEEKTEKNRAEFRKRLQGLMARYREGSLKREELRKDLAALQKAHAISEAALCREIMDRIDFDIDNSPVLDFLGERCPVDPAPLADLIAGYESDIRKTVSHRMGELKGELARNRGIGGSAVIPNPRADGVWKETVEALRKDYGRRLEQEKDRLAATVG
jgi:hypothetical protein